MQCLTRAYVKAVLYKLTVTAVRGTFKNLVAAVTLVAEQRVSQVFHVNPNLVRTACFQPADYILRDFENVVNVFITASMDFRVDVVSKVKQLDAEHARKLIEHVESRRAQYYNYYTGKRWGAAESYDLCIDASILGLEETEKLIADFIRKRFGL